MIATYFTPGPSHPYPRLREFLDDAWDQDMTAISHRGSAFSDIYRRTAVALRELIGIPDDYEIMFLGSATEAMERVIQGVVEEHSHHLVNGAFAEKWYEVAKQLGKHPTLDRADAGQGFLAKQMEIPKTAELVCITHNETSTGVVLPISDIVQVASAPGKPLVALDIVSSVPFVELPWSVLDLVFFSVQKAFGLPAGLGVLIASPRALVKAAQLEANGTSTGSYHALPRLSAAAGKFQTPATPNVLGIYLLGRVAEDMLARGMLALRRENQARAEALYEVLDTHEHLQPFVSVARWRSPTVVVSEVRGAVDPLHDAMAQHKLVIGKGYKPFTERHVRIANFPAIDAETFNILINKLQQFSV
jgi:phosphoserine aminotransferase